MAANIAEGCGKRGNGEFQRSLNIACGSASELDIGATRFVRYEQWIPLKNATVEIKPMLASKVEPDRLAGWMLIAESHERECC